MTARFDAIGMVTADMAATLAFYRLLGLDIPADADGQPHVEAPLPGGLRLMWDAEEAIKSFAPDFEPPTGEGRIGLAFRCEGPADVDATYATLTEAGHKGAMAPWDAEWGQRYAQVHDPDGNGVDLFAPLG